MKFFDPLIRIKNRGSRTERHSDLPHEASKIYPRTPQPMKHRLLLAVVGMITTGLLIGGLAKATATTSVDAATTTATTATTSDPSPPRGMGMMRGQGQGVTELAALLGLSTTDLQKKIDAGTPLYTIATEQGLTYSKLVEKQQSSYQTEINSMISSGFITTAQGEQFMSAWKDRAATDPMSVFMGGRGSHGFGRR